MSWKPVPLPDGCYADASLPFSAQDVVNYWVEFAEGQGTRSDKKLVQLPGLKPRISFGAGPHRGIRDVEGNLFVVADTHAYQVFEDDTVVQLGEIPGRGLVWISHNQITNGYQVMFSTGPEAWVYNTVTEEFTQVSDDAFKGARSLVYLNSRFLGIEQQGRFFANSALADGLSWDAIERYESESAPDRLVALIDFAGEILAFNKRTREHFQNTTDPTDIENHIYFTRVGPPSEVGAASGHAVSRLDGRVFFVGSDGAGYFVNGYGETRITTPAIETAWQACDITKCFAFTYESRGHSVWYVTFPDGQTWGYDCLSSARKGAPVWHRRQSLGRDRWRLNTLCKSNNRWYGGAYNSGVLYEVDWAYEGLEGCDEIVREYTSGVLHDDGNHVSLNGLRIECDTGNGTTECVEPITIDNPIDIHEGDFTTLPFWVGTGSSGYANKGPYDASTEYTSGIVANALREAPMPLGGDYALTYHDAGVLAAWKINRSTGLYESYTITSPVTATAFILSRDGAWFVAVDGTTLYSFKNTGTAFVQTDSLAGLAYDVMAFAPGGDRFAAFSFADSHLDLYSLDTTTGAMTIGAGWADLIERMAWSRDGRYLAVGISNPAPTAGTLSVYDTNNVLTLTNLDNIPAMTSNRTAVCWNRDGSRIWYTAGSIGLVTVATFDGSAFVSTVNHDISADSAAEVQVSPSGRYLMVIPFGTYAPRLYQIGDNGYGTTLTEIAVDGFAGERGGGWPDFFDTWVDS